MARGRLFDDVPRILRWTIRLFVASWALSGAAASLADPAPAAPMIELSGLTFVVERGSESELVIWSERAYYDPIGQAVTLQQVNLSVGPALDPHGMMIRCDTGVLALTTNHFRLSGAVSGVTGDGRRFEAEWLEYDAASKRLFSDSPVLIREAGGVYRGGGLEYTIDTRALKLFGGARVVRAP